MEISVAFQVQQVVEVRPPFCSMYLDYGGLIRLLSEFIAQEAGVEKVAIEMSMEPFEIVIREVRDGMRILRSAVSR